MTIRPEDLLPPAPEKPEPRKLYLSHSELNDAIIAYIAEHRLPPNQKASAFKFTYHLEPWPNDASKRYVDRVSIDFMVEAKEGE